MMYANDAQQEQWLRPLAQRRDARRVLPHRAACRQRCIVAAHHRRARWRPLRAQRRQAVHHQRQARRRRHRDGCHRQGGRQEGHQRLLVPTATPGYVVARLEEKMGQHSSDTAQIIFENCRVPAQNLIGEEGRWATALRCRGWKAGGSALPRKAVGMARAAFEAALAYAKERDQLRPAAVRASGGAVPPGRHGYADRGGAADDPGMPPA
jgi:butyryl-CoA dehydrogenase